MTSRCPGALAASTSTSAHSATRWLVVRSTSTTVASASSEESRSVHEGSCDVAGSRSSNQVSSGVLALNPSLRFHGVGSTGTPEELTRMPSGGNEMRRPVAAVSSAALSASLGNGSTHERVSSASQPGDDLSSWATTAPIVASSAGVGAGSVVVVTAAVVVVAGLVEPVTSVVDPAVGSVVG
jgi:hypothetical protein